MKILVIIALFMISTVSFGAAENVSPVKDKVVKEEKIYQKAEEITVKGEKIKIERLKGSQLGLNNEAIGLRIGQTTAAPGCPDSFKVHEGNRTYEFRKVKGVLREQGSHIITH